MGLRCLLGHDFGEPETERQRNEEGNEVVVTVREVKTCQTCGETRVVSENKEIKSIEQLRRSAMDEEADSPSYGGAEGAGNAGTAHVSDSPGSPTDHAASADAADQSATVGADATPGPVQSGDEAGGIADAIQNAEPGDGDAGALDEDDGVLVDDGATDEGADAPEAPIFSGAERPADESVAESPSDSTEDAMDADPVEEDAVILDDEDDDKPSESERKQWEETADPDEIPGRNEPKPEPDGDDAVIMGAEGADEPSEPETTEDGYTPWPKQHAEDEGHKAGIPDDDTPGVDFGGGLTPSNSNAASKSEPKRDDADVEVSSSTGDAASNQTDVGRTETKTSRNGAEERTTHPAPESSLDLERSARDADLEYHCPDCGLTRPVGTSSMRAGDICPECRRGYITERPRTN